MRKRFYRQVPEESKKIVLTTHNDDHDDDTMKQTNTADKLDLDLNNNCCHTENKNDVDPNNNNIEMHAKDETEVIKEQEVLKPERDDKNIHRSLLMKGLILPVSQF